MSIPADANPADNDFWFVFEQPAPRRTIVVVDDPQAARPLAAGRVDLAGPGAAVHGRSRRRRASWRPSTGTRSSLLLWQAPLPEARRGQADPGVHRARRVGDLLSAASARRRRALRRALDDLGRGEVGHSRSTSWRGDRGPAGAHRRAAAAAGRRSFEIRKYCGLSGEVTPLATLARRRAAAGAGRDRPRGGLFLRDDAGRRRFVAGDQRRRALRAGPARAGLGRGGRWAARGSSRRRAASRRSRAPGSASPGGEEALSTEYPFHRGVYQAGERLLAVNRSAAEEHGAGAGRRRVAELFRGLDFARVDDRAGNLGSLIQEIWRLFLVAMMVAMVVEAALCLPKLARPRGAAA